MVVSFFFTQLVLYYTPGCMYSHLYYTFWVHVIYFSIIFNILYYQSQDSTK